MRLEGISGVFVGTQDPVFRMVENVGRALTRSSLQAGSARVQYLH